MLDGDIQKIDFDENIAETVKLRFERQACIGMRAESTSFIRSAYMNSLDINGHTDT